MADFINIRARVNNFRYNALDHDFGDKQSVDVHASDLQIIDAETYNAPESITIYHKGENEPEEHWRTEGREISFQLESNSFEMDMVFADSLQQIKPQ